MSKKIIVIEHEPFSQRKQKHYFITEFLKQGYAFEYWSAKKALCYAKDVHYAYNGQGEHIKEIQDKQDLFTRLHQQNPQDTFFFLEIWFKPSTAEVFKFLYDHGFKWGRMEYYLNPIQCLDNRKGLKEKIRTLSLQTFREKMERNLFRLKYRDLPIQVSDVTFITGNNQDYVSKTKQIVPFNYFDVATYQREQNSDALLDYDYILFLDIMLVNHPDIVRDGYQNNGIDPQHYYAKLNAFFTAVEKAYGMPVVIAAHPKGVYTGAFNNRLCIKDNTANLSLHSQLVLTHGSLSISYALFSYKPLIYIDLSKEFDKNALLRRIKRRLSKAIGLLGTTVVDISQKDYVLPKLEAMTVDRAKYDAFTTAYYLADADMDNFGVVRKVVEDLFVAVK